MEKKTCCKSCLFRTQLCTDPLRKEWLLAAPALRRPAITEPTRCAKDQTAAGDTLHPQGLRWVWLSLRKGHDTLAKVPGHGAPGAMLLTRSPSER